mmetsp:Transcript_30672/g.60189  ORF Transcript_30672/g.60189 Transcript_30672/m.60189 type:complete len:205 (-) Transcript_30672:77-691(-)
MSQTRSFPAATGELHGSYTTLRPDGTTNPVRRSATLSKLRLNPPHAMDSLPATPSSALSLPASSPVFRLHDSYLLDTTIDDDDMAHRKTVDDALLATLVGPSIVLPRASSVPTLPTYLDVKDIGARSRLGRLAFLKHLPQTPPSANSKRDGMTVGPYLSVVQGKKWRMAPRGDYQPGRLLRPWEIDSRAIAAPPTSCNPWIHTS